MQIITALKTDVLISLILPTDYETQNCWLREKNEKGKKS